jgi:hypoxanthine phosphoribosyltransferase
MERSMSERIEEMISEEKVNARICELGAQISKDYAGEKVHLICILKVASFFACELAKRITIPVTIDFMSVSSYGGSTTSTGVVKIVKDLDEPIADENVIVVEDIVDTGRTLSYLLDMLKDRGPKSLKLCALLDKPERRVVEIEADYKGFEVPDEFIVGYGLDYDQKYRNLPYIGIVKFE